MQFLDFNRLRKQILEGTEQVSGLNSLLDEYKRVGKLYEASVELARVRIWEIYGEGIQTTQPAAFEICREISSAIKNHTVARLYLNDLSVLLQNIMNDLSNMYAVQILTGAKLAPSQMPYELQLAERQASGIYARLSDLSLQCGRLGAFIELEHDELQRRLATAKINFLNMGGNAGLVM